jgi:hypothetical protein
MPPILRRLRYRETSQRNRLILRWLSVAPQFHWQNPQFFHGPRNLAGFGDTLHGLNGPWENSRLILKHL